MTVNLIKKYFTQFFIVILISFTLIKFASAEGVDVSFTRIWGPGLEPHTIIMPARYFFIQAFDSNNQSITSDLGPAAFDVNLEGSSTLGKPCRIWLNLLNRKDGSYIVRYKLFETCLNLQINVKHDNVHVAESPYVIKEPIYADECDCPVKNLNEFFDAWKCGEIPPQIRSDLDQFQVIDWDQIRAKVIEKYNQPLSVSICHYVIKNNDVYRQCYGKYVGFKMFMDSVLLSLARKVSLPDSEFFVNLGDWPLVRDQSDDMFPVFSWCGSTDSKDIVMPTYDITESSLENMGRVMLDMLSVQGNVKDAWENRIPKVFWRGRDSNQHRLDLIDISREHPDLFNVSLTNFFFFRDKVDRYGPKVDHVSFFDFFNYKYQVSIDGTVAAYRFPYLLAGGSLIFKQNSKYFEHFYNELKENFHYLPIKMDLSDLTDKVNWAVENDLEAKNIAQNGRRFANERLLPQHIFCYYARLLQEFSKKIVSKVRVLESMEKVEQVKQKDYCDNCKENRMKKDEL